MSQEIYIIPQDVNKFTFKYFFENIKDVKEFYVYGNISQHDSLLNLSNINVHFKDGGDCYIMRSDYEDYHWYSAFDYLNDSNTFGLRHIEDMAKKWELLNFIRFTVGSNDVMPLHLNKNFIELVICMCKCLNGYVEVVDSIPQISHGIYDIEKWVNLNIK